jgi:hypothetical protein
MLLSPFGNLSHTSILLLLRYITLSFYMNIKPQLGRLSACDLGRYYYTKQVFLSNKGKEDSIPIFIDFLRRRVP